MASSFPEQNGVMVKSKLLAANATAETLMLDQPLASTPVSNNKPVRRLWNLQDADILSVINEVSQETGKNFMV